MEEVFFCVFLPCRKMWKRAIRLVRSKKRCHLLGSVGLLAAMDFDKQTLVRGLSPSRKQPTTSKCLNTQLLRAVCCLGLLKVPQVSEYEIDMNALFSNRMGLRSCMCFMFFSVSPYIPMIHFLGRVFFKLHLWRCAWINHMAHFFLCRKYLFHPVSTIVLCITCKCFWYPCLVWK